MKTKYVLIFALTAAALLSAPAGAALVVEKDTSWFITDSTYGFSVRAANVDADSQTEVVTGGAFNNGGSNWDSLLRVWNQSGGSDGYLGLETSESWGGAANVLDAIATVYIADVDGDGVVEIITGGRIVPQSGVIASQIRVYNKTAAGGSLSLENNTTWTTDSGTAQVFSIDVADVDRDGFPEILAGGRAVLGSLYYAQLTIWNKSAGGALSLENNTTWRIGSDEGDVWSVRAADVDGDGVVEILTAGNNGPFSFDTSPVLRVWSKSGDGALTLENSTVVTGLSAANARYSSVDAADVDGDGKIEMVAGGHYTDGASNVYALLDVWSKNSDGTLALENRTTWRGVGNTYIYSVRAADVDNDGTVEIVTGGKQNNGARDNAQVRVWSVRDGALALEDELTWFNNSDTQIGDQSEAVTVGDYDGDGVLEILTAGYYNDGVRQNSQIRILSSPLATNTSRALLSLSGKLKYANGTLAQQGSFRVTIKTEDNATTWWGPYTFNNSVSNGDYGLLLGGQQVLKLAPGAAYRLDVEVCDVPTFTTTAGNCVAGSARYDPFTTYFKG